MKRIRQWSALAFLGLVLLVAVTGCEQPTDNCGGSSVDCNGFYDNGGSNAVGYGAKYALSGPYIDTEMSIPGYTIFYPRKMDGGHPIITWGNGTFAPTKSYWGLLRHLASWGFVVIASDSTSTHDGKEMIRGVNRLLLLNKMSNSLFYGKLDPESIGTAGHSQGGGGAINAAANHRVKCALPIAPAQAEIEKVECPIFLIAGSQDTIVPPYWVRFTSYDVAQAPTIFGVIQDMGHFDFLGFFDDARGYITAWFMYQLKGDTDAAQVFVGECEICDNPDWTVEKKNF